MGSAAAKRPELTRSHGNWNCGVYGGLWRMLANGQLPSAGPILVTGATGGVGTLAIDIFTRAGFAVQAISGKTEQFEYLKSLGATAVIDRHSVDFGSRPLESAQWAGALDNVGGAMLGDLCRVIKPWGSIASCGMAGGHEVHTTVMPFIIRGVSILGINSANTPMPIRAELWRRLASDWKPAHLDKIVQSEVSLSGLPDVFARLIKGGALGRVVVVQTPARFHPARLGHRWHGKANSGVRAWQPELKAFVSPFDRSLCTKLPLHCG